MATYKYHVTTYVCDSPRLEDVSWMQDRQSPDLDYQTAKQVFDDVTERLSADTANECVYSQPRRNEERAMQQRGSSMRAETYHRYLSNGIFRFTHVALYVTEPKAA